MTTLDPELVAYGDLHQVIMDVYRDRLVAITLREGDLVSLHLDGSEPYELTDLPIGGSKGRIGGAIIGEILHLVWDGGGVVTYMRWHIGLRQVNSAPTSLVNGSKPTIEPRGSGIIIGYIDDDDQYHVIQGNGIGGPWSTPRLVCPEVVEDADMYMPADRPFELSVATIRVVLP